MRRLCDCLLAVASPLPVRPGIPSSPSSPPVQPVIPSEETQLVPFIGVGMHLWCKPVVVSGYLSTVATDPFISRHPYLVTSRSIATCVASVIAFRLSPPRRQQPPSVPSLSSPPPVQPVIPFKETQSMPFIRMHLLLLLLARPPPARHAQPRSPRPHLLRPDVAPSRLPGAFLLARVTQPLPAVFFS